jgi:hypothetical protein
MRVGLRNEEARVTLGEVVSPAPMTERNVRFDVQGGSEASRVSVLRLGCLLCVTCSCDTKIGSVEMEILCPMRARVAQKRGQKWIMRSDLYTLMGFLWNCMYIKLVRYRKSSFKLYSSYEIFANPSRISSAENGSGAQA